jgi:hypothetical protein
MIWRWVVNFTSRPPPGKGPKSSHWIGGWMGLRASLEEVERRKLLPLPRLKLRPLRRPTRSQSLYRRSYPGSFCVSNASSKYKFLQGRGQRKQQNRLQPLCQHTDRVKDAVCVMMLKMHRMWDSPSIITLSMRFKCSSFHLGPSTRFKLWPYQ